VSSLQETEAPETPEELLGELAHELSLLVRSDLELAAAQRGPELREVATELAAVSAAAAASLLALAALSWAAIQGLTLAFPSWLAALLVALGWVAVAALLLRIDHPRRLQRRLQAETQEQAIAAAREHRIEAEQAMRTTARNLGRAVAREIGERELRAIAAVEDRLVHAAERDVEAVLKELVNLVRSPGRAGKSLFERIVGGDSQPPESHE